MVRPKLVAFDLDGTLIGRDLAISLRVRESIARMQAEGVAGVMVTGRMYRAALPFARALDFDAPLICYQGAAIVDPSNDRVLRDIPLPNSTVRAIITIAQSSGMHLQLYRNDSYYCERRNQFSDLYAQFAQIQPVIVDDLSATFAASEATKAVIVASPPEAERYAEILSVGLGGLAYVTRSSAEFVEILNPIVDKGEALVYLASTLGVEMTSVFAVGDSWNDVPLLRAAGFGIAMGSAPQELRAVASAIVADVEHDGVADAIEGYVFAAAQ